jgi:hypothetical protein
MAAAAAEEEEFINGISKKGLRLTCDEMTTQEKEKQKVVEFFWISRNAATKSRTLVNLCKFSKEEDPEHEDPIPVHYASKYILQKVMQFLEAITGDETEDLSNQEMVDKIELETQQFDANRFCQPVIDMCTRPGGFSIRDLIDTFKVATFLDIPSLEKRCTMAFALKLETVTNETDILRLFNSDPRKEGDMGPFSREEKVSLAEAHRWCALDA